MRVLGLCSYPKEAAATRFRGATLGVLGKAVVQFGHAGSPVVESGSPEGHARILRRPHEANVGEHEER